MVQLAKNWNKDPESSRVVELPADDYPNHEDLDLHQDPPAKNLTPAEQELQQRLLNMENILHEVVYENSKL